MAATHDRSRARRPGTPWARAWQSLMRTFALPPEPAGDRGGFARLLRLEDRTLPSATPLGTEFLINQTVAGTQQTTAHPPRSVAVDPKTGNFVAVWSSLNPNATYDVYGRLFNAAGAPLTPEFQVNPAGLGNSVTPAVAMDGSGNFVIVWSSDNQNTTGNSGVYARAYDAAGNPLTGVYTVAGGTNSNAQNPTVAADAAGDVVVAWTSDVSGGPDIFAQRYDAQHNQVGTTFRVNTTTSRNESAPAAAMDAQGDFVVTWLSNQNGGHQVFAQLYQANGSAVGTETQLSSGGSNQQDPAVTMSATGGYTAVWSSNQGLLFRQIYGRQVKADGNPMGKEFPVASYLLGDTRTPSIATEPNGNDLVSWSANGEDALLTWGVYAEEMTPSGSVVTSPFLVNSTTAGDQQYSSAAAGPFGDVLVWSGNGVGDPNGVFGRRFNLAPITVSPASGLVTTEAGGTASFRVVLDSRPSGSVTITLTSSNPAQGVPSTSTLTFTPTTWNQAQTVTVTGQDDHVVNGDQPYTIDLTASSSDQSYNGAGVAVGLTNQERDVASVSATPASGLVTTKARGTAQFAVDLTSQPASTVVVNVASSNPAEGVPSVTALTFDAGNWNSPQTVTVTGQDDGNPGGSSTYTVNLSASSADPNYNGPGATVSLTNVPERVLVVTTAADVVDGDTSSVSALLANEGADGHISLREAILATNNTPGAEIIDFAIGSGPQTIRLSAALGPLPTVTGPVTIDGTSQPGFAGAPIIALDGSSGGSAADGLVLTGGKSTVRGLVIENFGGDGIRLDGPGGYVAQGNYIGTDLSGTNADPNGTGLLVNSPDNLIGGTTPAERNVISGNRQYGIFLTGPAATGNLLQGNYVGTDATGTHALGNGADGVTFNNGASGNTVGGTAAGAANVIADNGGSGVVVLGAGSVQDEVRGNSIYGNNRLGIDLGNDGVTPNVSAPVRAGPNQLEDYPVLVSAGLGSNGLEVTGSVHGAPNTSLLLDFFDNPAADPSGHGQGHYYLGSLTVLTDGSGDATFAATLPGAGVGAGDAISATATDPAGNTSEFAADVTCVPTAVRATPASGLTTTEAGGTAQFNVTLTSAPQAAVVVSVGSSDPGQGVPSVSSLTFTPADWSTPQAVTVTGQDDHVVNGDQSYTVNLSASSADADYNGQSAAVALVNQERDVASIRATPSAGLVTTEAGGTAQFQVTLTSQPAGQVVVGVSSSNPADGTPSVSGLTFDATNWNSPQTVTVTGQDDHIVNGDQTYTINLSASAGDPNYNGRTASVSLTNQERDVAGITVTPTSGLVTTDTGGTAAFSVVLTSEPTADVVIPLRTSNPLEGTVNTPSLTFTPGNWSTPQQVTITGQKDGQPGTNPVSYSIITDPAVSGDPVYSGMDAVDVSVVNDKTPPPGITVTPTSGLVTTESGGAAQFTVVLKTQPTGDVTIGLSSSDPQAGTVSSPALVFTPADWNVPQTVTVTGQDDHVVTPDVQYRVVTAPAVSSDMGYNGLEAADVSLTNRETDVASFVVTPTSVSVFGPARGTATFTVALTSQPTGAVTVALSSSDPSAGTPSAPALTFTPGDWNVPQGVSVLWGQGVTANDSVTLTIRTAPAVSADLHYQGVDPADVAITQVGIPATVPPVVTPPVTAPPPPTGGTTPAPQPAGPVRTVTSPPSVSAPEGTPPVVAALGPDAGGTPVVDPGGAGDRPRGPGRSGPQPAPQPQTALAGSVVSAGGDATQLSGGGGASAVFAGANGPLAAPQPIRLTATAAPNAPAASPTGGIPGAAAVLAPRPEVYFVAAPEELASAPPTAAAPTAAFPPLVLREAFEELSALPAAAGLSREATALAGTGLLASTGYLLLNTRAGLWLLSLLMAKPLWKQFDPLEVLYAWEQEEQARQTEDGETLLTMVE